MFWKALRTFNSIVPKKDLILLYSIPDFSDNVFYLYKRMREQGICELYECIWIVNTEMGKLRVERFGGKAILRSDRKLLLRLILQTKYMISSHGPPLWRGKNQTSIELYHGIPLKRLLKRFGNAIDKFVVPSEFVGVLFSANFQAPLDRFIPLGQPRCDALFSSRTRSFDLLNTILGIDVNEFERILLYLPTFRDYDMQATVGILMDLFHDGKFRSFLKDRNILFLIKPHPRNEEQFQQYEHYFDNFRIIKNYELLERYITLYDLLPSVDILITDYSSVYFDYLLLNRPIVFYAPDLEEYRRTRGFLLEPYERWTPGDKARNVSELIAAIEEALTNPGKWRKEREWLRDVMFKYQDGKSSERIIRYFWGDT